jgi:hypothetical protein
VIDLARDAAIDFAAVPLGYEAFRRLAVNPNLSEHGRIGFPDAYREGREADIFLDIRAKLPQLDGQGMDVLDIGPGCAGLPRLLIAHCARQGHRLHLVDSPEMLARLGAVPDVTRTAGAFPACMDTLAGRRFDAILCYSVLHYVLPEAGPFAVVDATVAALAPGGRALFGDIPNHSKRRRFFASAAGQAFHRAFTGSDDPPDLRAGPAAGGDIADRLLRAMMRRAQQAGCDAYLLPQPAALPMANRRDDLLIARP